MNKPEKLSLEKFTESIISCIQMDELYLQFEEFINELLTQIDSFNFTGNLEKDIISFMKIKIQIKDNYHMIFEKNKRTELVGYRILLSMLGVSLEQMKNIIIPNYRNLNTFNETKLTNNNNYASCIANLFIYGYNDDQLKNILNGDIITLKRFNLSQYDDLEEFIQTKKGNLRQTLEDAYKSRIENKKGYFVETNILGSIVKDLGYTYEAGKLDALEKYFDRKEAASDKNKRNPNIDLIIPSKENPILLIESSYQLTTASGQTKKIDANYDVYKAIKKYSKDLGREIIFINFVDGAGWKARGESDLSRLVSSCDYIINYNNLDHFKDILEYHLKEDKTI